MIPCDVPACKRDYFAIFITPEGPELALCDIHYQNILATRYGKGMRCANP